MKVVGSITTIPGRYPKLLRTLKSLKDQDRSLDAIYLGIPKESKRLKQSYPELPVEIAELCTVVPCDYDYGPCTKIVGALLQEDDPSTIIITFDDDVIYAPDLVSTLLEYHEKYPEASIGSSGFLLRYSFPFYSTITNSDNNWNRLTGFDLPETGRSVDSLCGFSGVLYMRKFFPPKNQLHNEFLKYPLMDPDVYFNDDIMISAYLSGKDIDRRIFPSIPSPGRCSDSINDTDGNEISFDKLAFLRRFRRSIDKVKEWGFFKQTETVTLAETAGGRLVIVTITIIILILLVLLMLLTPFRSPKLLYM